MGLLPISLLFICINFNGVSERRNRTLLDMVLSVMSQITLPKSFWDYALESAVRILNMVLTKKVEKTPYEVWSIRTRHALDRMCLNFEADEYELEDFNKPANYKAALLDPGSDKWLNPMNVEIKFMKDNEVWDLVDLLPNGKTVGSKWLFKKKTNMNGADVKSYLRRCFAMKDLGEAAYILGIKIYRDRSKRKSQGALILAEVKHMQNVPYASMVGSIMYVVRCARPDVAFAQNITSRFQQNPELRVSCYTDAGYLTKADDLKSQTGYVFVLNGGDVDWKSIKQSIFITSYAEAEYIVVLDASKEAVWVRKYISGLGVVPVIEEPIKMYYDNTGAITIANESGITKDARHYHAKVHYLHKVIEFGSVKIQKVHTDDNLTDPFTKALAFPKHSEHTKNIGMLPASNLM
uniref:Retrotransposon protein, putative, Ty1-copia subclass n=1 Tax=Tanacetum cinerariifolium TaxID=118510 RepID=A0A6L2KEX1_TANCI|nr:hypothetical protein [Tanacetum cinerariifolium]